ncbi:MAG: YIP1 family protein [Woeseiaceae bacterium]
MSNGEEQRPPGEQADSHSQPEADTQVASALMDPGAFVDQAAKVITNPVGFYQSMPKSGGYTDPLVFMVVLAVASGVISAVLSMAGIGFRGVVVGGFMAIVFVPVFAVVFGFVGAAIVYVIWKVLGSDENFETAYRCVAYSSAIGPVLTVLGLIPIIGSIASAVWPMALMAIAGIHVHRRNAQVCWSVFGALALFLMVTNMAAERQADEMADSLQSIQRMMEEEQRQ